MPISAFVLIVALLGSVILVLMIPRPRGDFFRILGVSLTTALLVEVVAAILVDFGEYNAWVYSAYVLVEMTLLIYLIYKTNDKLKIHSTIGFIISLLAVLFSTYYVKEIAADFIVEGALVVGFVLVVLSLLVLFDLAQNDNVVMYRHPKFWVFLGMIIYFGGYLPALGSRVYVAELDEDLGRLLFRMVPILGAVRYAFAGYAAYLESQNRRAKEV